MTGCEAFEIAVLRRARGALDADASTALAAHLGTCDACRRYAELAEATESALRARAASAAETGVAAENAGVTGDGTTAAEPTGAAAGAGTSEYGSVRLQRARAAIRRRLDDDRSRNVRGVLLAAAIVALQACVDGATAALVTAGVVLAVIAITARTVVRRRRDLVRAAESPEGELVAHLRADLDREIAELRRAKPTLVPLAVLYGLLLAVFAANLVKDLWLLPRPVSGAALTLPVFTLLAGGRLWWNVRHRLPRLERERGDLS